MGNVSSRSRSIQGAASHGDIDAVKALLQSGVNVNARARSGVDTIVAAHEEVDLSPWRGHLDVLRGLFQHRADRDAAESDGNTALISAALKRHMEVVRYLVEQGADVEATNDHGATPLIVAARCGDLDLVKYLVERGADKDTTDRDGHTALMVAACNGDEEIVCYLVHSNADSGSKNDEGNTALLLAAREGHDNVVQFLIEESEADWLDTNHSGQTALTLSAWQGRLRVVRYLIKHGTDDGDKLRNLNLALLSSACGGHLDVVQHLIEHGADKEARDTNGNTVLILAAHNKRLGIVRYLIEQGADKEAENRDGETALLRSACEGHLDIVQFLVESGADFVTVTDCDGITPAIGSARCGNLDLVKYFFEQGVNPEARDRHGNTLLMWAAWVGHLGVVQFILSHGANKSARNHDGDTALILAADRGHQEVLRHLLHECNDIGMADNAGATALTYAARKGHLQAVELLLENGADPSVLDGEDNSVVVTLLLRDDADDDMLCPIVKMLLENGAPPLKSNKKGVSAKSIANKKNLQGVLFLLEEYAALTRPRRERKEEDRANPKWFIAPEDVCKRARLSEGGSGVVYAATWEHIDVVVKEISLVEMRRFLGEVTTWASLRHDNVVPFFGANHRDEPYFIVSKFAANGELISYLKHERDKGRNVAWRKLNEVATGLSYLHSRKIVHGDLKGSNIVVNEHGVAMLTDFGLSFVESGRCSLLEKMKDHLGAMAWRAPEFANLSTTTPTRKSDVYSLGMCVIEAVTGKRPWAGRSNEEIACKLHDGTVEIDRPEGITDPQWELVQRLIAVSPSDRPNVADVLIDFEAFAAAEEYAEESTKPTCIVPLHVCDENLDPDAL